MTRCAASALAALLLAGPGAARADCLSWTEAGVVVEHGTLRGLPPGAARFRIGRAAAGGSHMRTVVELRWAEPGGRETRQVLFGAIQDGLPLLAVRRGQLRLRVTHCPIGQDCRDTTLAFAWDRAARRFAGADPAATEALATACTPE
jgi:hypothetical protein